MIENEKRVIDYTPTFRGGLLYAFSKRLFDIIASFLGILLLLPFMLVIIIIIGFTFDGHCIYVDKRVGKKGKEINVLKFRTMYKDAEKNASLYLNEDQMQEYEDERKVSEDPRVTKLGWFLRRTSLDELPQLFNILIGNMTFVGPRAITKKELERNFSDEQRKLLLKVRPGLTGNWCAYGRYTATFKKGDRQRLELEYLSKRSFFKDLRIIFATLFCAQSYKDSNK